MVMRIALALFALLTGLAAAPAALAQTTFDFAGHSWIVRSWGGGPGPNEWRDDNVRLADDGVHLTIRQVDGVWSAAEIVMLGDPLGFGTYEFEIAGDLSTLDTNAVVGLFNYPGSPEIGPDGTNEIDIEIAQWGDRSNNDRLNWNIHPATATGSKGHNAVPLPPGATETTHRFTWTADSIAYGSVRGFADGETKPIASWTYAPADPASDIPQHPLVVHVNLWLVEGKPPASGAPVEIVLRDFRFTPAP
jgi:hypothetical protein